MTRNDRQAAGARLWPAILSRTTAAILGGYALTWSVSGALSLIPNRPVDAVYLVSMLSLLVMTGAVIWAFATRTAARAWTGLLLPALAFAAIIILVRGIGA